MLDWRVPRPFVNLQTEEMLNARKVFNQDHITSGISVSDTGCGQGQWPAKHRFGDAVRLGQIGIKWIEQALSRWSILRHWHSN